MLAAISLVSFIGVFIAVVLITRRLKMVKAIRGGQRGKRPIRRPWDQNKDKMDIIIMSKL